MKEIKLQIPDGKKAEWKDINGVQTLVLIDEEVKDSSPVTERIKTFEDACRELGKTHPFVETWHSVYKILNSKGPSYKNIAGVIAYHKLRIITAALNEGWEPKFTEDECRWYPWFYLYTEDELAEKDDKWKQSHHVIATGNYDTEYAGFVYSNSYYVPSYALTHFGSRLCYRSEALADYSGKQFIGLWAEFNLIIECAFEMYSF